MFLTDSLTNLVSGLGTDKDKLTHSHFRPTLLNKFELDSLYSSDWISGKIVDAPCDDMTREWRQWDGGKRQSAALEREEKRLGVRQKVNHALKLARLYGGAAIIIGDGSADPSKPLDVERIQQGGVKYLSVLSRWEITVMELNRDPLSQWFGEPELYVVSGGSRSAEVHPSRVVRFLGQAKLEQSNWFDGWGLPTLQRAYDAIRGVAAAVQNTASLTHEAKVDVVSIPGLNENALNPDYRAKLLARFSLASTAKSNQNALLLDASEEWSQKQVTFTGLVDVVNKFLEVAAGAADMPVTRLLGTSPKGLNATGQSDFRAYYDMLAARQEVELSPALNRLDEALIRSALGARPASVKSRWLPLWQMTEAEQAAIALQRAQATQIYAVMGAMPPSALREGIQSQLVRDGIYPGLEAMIAAAIAAGEAPGPIAQKLAMTPEELNTPSASARVANS